MSRAGTRAVLRAPAFPQAEAMVTRPGRGPALAPEAVDRLFAAIREVRVGGSFWAPAHPRHGAAVVVRARPGDEPEQADALWVETARETVDPWSVLDGATTLVAHGDDEWVALAVIAGVAVRLLSAGRFGAPGDDAARLRQRVAEDLAAVCYRDPFTDAEAGVAETVALLGAWRGVFEGNRAIVAACGFSWWKRHEIARFLWTPEHPLRFFRSERRALAHAARYGGAVAIWPSRVSDAMIAAAAAQAVPLVRVEDGFVRSVGLGSNLVPPSSITVDRRGIHYDPTRASDLELLLAEAAFPAPLLARAARLRATILAAGISKYGSGSSSVFPEREAGKRLVLVPGQVEDDMSVRLGGGGLASNLELVRRVRALEPDAEIWFRPHPDVDAGHRAGVVRDEDALRYANRVVRGGGMAQLLDLVDSVHVLTSLTGFEALLRGRDVTCHGTPFFAGWGLTRDLLPAPPTRGRPLTLDQLIAGVLIVYPRYLDPVTGLPCPPEVLIERMRDGPAHNRLGWVSRARAWQGRLARRVG